MRFRKLTAVLLAAVLSAGMFAGCGINKNATVATMGSTKVEMGLVNFMCRYRQAGLDDFYRAYFGDDVWNTDLYGNGKTMEENMKSDIVDQLHELYTLDAHADEYGVSVSDEEKQAITDAAAAFIAANSKETLEEMGAEQGIIEEMLRLYTIKAKMYQEIMAGADTEVTDEEANMRGYTMASANISQYYDTENNSYMTYTEEEIAEITANMEKFAEAVEDGKTMEEAGEEFEVTVKTGTYAASDESLEADVKTALDALKEGETSSLITTDSAIYLVRLDSETDEDATEQNRSEIIEARKSTLLTETVDGWQAEDGWKVNEKELNKISFFNILTAQNGETQGAESVTDAEDGTVTVTETVSEDVTEEVTE